MTIHVSENNGNITFVPGKQYLNRLGHHIFLTKAVADTDPVYGRGYRFQDERGQYYDDQGRVTFGDDVDEMNLVAEWNPSMTTETVVIDKPGLFGRLGQKIKANPGRSVLTGAAVAGVAGLGGYNYNTYGNVMGNTGVGVDEGAEIAAAMVGWFSNWA